MSKVNFFALTRPEMPQEGPRTFREPRYKENKALDVTLTLQALDNIQQTEVSVKAREMLAKYVGDPENGIDPTDEMQPLEGYCFELNEEICMKAMRLCLMQRPDKASSRYTFEELIAMSVTMPVVWEQVMTWHYKLNASARALPKNPSGEETTGEASM